ncbi:MAG: PD-(D/E)XK nuclease family protein [Anaerolineales bacterium]
MTTASTPRGLKQVKRTKPISPSQLPAFALCPLRYVLQTEPLGVDTVPAGLPAVRGIALHNVIERYMGRTLPASGELREAFLEAAQATAEKQGNAVIRRAMQSAGIRSLFPTQRVLSDVQFIRTLLGRYPRSGTQPGIAVPAAPSSSASSRSFGTERKLASARLDMEGRIDLLLKDAEGSIHVVDYKSGRVSDSDGNPKDSFLMQVAAYGLLVKEAFDPSSPIVLELVGPSSVWEGPFDEQLEQTVLMLLAALKTRLPKHVPLEAAELAILGEHCHSCPFRPACPAYLTALATGEAKGLSPADISGVIVEAVHREDLATLRVLNTSGRIVAISGVPLSERCRLAPGVSIEGFSLGIADVLATAPFPANFYQYRKDDPRQSAFGSLIRPVPDPRTDREVVQVG